MNKKNVMTIALVGLIFLTGIFVIAIKYGIMAERSDRAEAQSIGWIEQFGTSLDDRAEDVAADTSGNIYVVGYTEGTLPVQSSSGEVDAFIRKYNSGGTEQWTRQFGTSATDEARGVSIDSSGNIYVVGDTEGTLPGQSSSGEADAFIRKYNSGGTEQWTRQFGSSADDIARNVSADSSGVYVVGTTVGTLPGQSWAGSNDAFIIKYDINGNKLWTRQFGTVGADEAYDVSLDSSGNIYVVGITRGALPGQTYQGGGDAYIRKYDENGNIITTFGAGDTGTVQFGTSAFDIARNVSIDSSGNIYVIGDTDGTLPGQSPNPGGYDAYIRKYDADGNVGWTNQFGTSTNDLCECVSVDSSGIYIGGYTWGTLPGQSPNPGGYDAYIRKYDADGNVGWTNQFGTSNDDWALGVSAVPSGVYMAGSTMGTLGQTSQGAEDAFVIKFIVDTIPPVITKTSPQDGAEYLEKTPIPLAVSITDSLSGVKSWVVNLDDIPLCSHSTPCATSINPLDPGPHTVRVEAEDKAGNQAVDEETFTVITAAEGVGNIIEDVEDLDIKKGVSKSLSSQLNAIKNLLEADKPEDKQAAINMLQAFINECNAQRGKALTNDQAESLIDQAQKIIEILYL